MRDAFINALNTQKITSEWVASLSENLTNIYTPGYREQKFTFKTFLNGSIAEDRLRNLSQGKSSPGTSDENIFLEGSGYFAIRNDEGRIAYTRLGEFKFDGEGVYRTHDGQAVQGYILNDKGEIMNGAKPVDAESFVDTPFDGGAASVPTTNIKLWKDPSNGKYLGKYEEFEFAGDGILYGKADGGKIKTPLYKVAVINFHNPQMLFQVADGQFIETEESGRPIIGRGEVRGGLIELSNVDFDTNTAYYQQAQMQLELANQLIKSHKQLLQNAIELMGS
ncbi:MAG: flagellar hook basal-body protein [Cyanobacteria bacterium SIG29]|nr:flagellar hook basal-body protein [Cyanobacteria bacterium SIG29]